MKPSYILQKLNDRNLPLNIRFEKKFCLEIYIYALIELHQRQDNRSLVVVNPLEPKQEKEKNSIDKVSTLSFQTLFLLECSLGVSQNPVLGQKTQEVLSPCFEPW